MRIKLVHSVTLLLAILVAMQGVAAHAQTTAPATPLATRAMIVSIDGLRPDVALRAKTPTLHALMERGSFTFWARTTAMAVTLPSHTSMLTGVPPNKHGIVWNSDIPLAKPIYPAWPTIFELAKKQGFSTAMAAGKVKFNTLAKPKTIDAKFVSADTGTDDDVAVAAESIISEYKPQVLFVHFPGVDTAGHKYGWGSDEQLAAAEKADSCLGQVLDALAAAKVLEGTFIIVSADHGGQGKTHGPDDERSRHIPWISAGPGVRHNYDLTRDDTLVVHTEDTFATTCYMLGIKVAKKVDGVPVKQILQSMATTAPASTDDD